MAKLDSLEDARVLRDSARELFFTEFEHVRNAARPSAIGERMVSRVGEKADAASDAALGFAESHRGLAVGVIGAMIGATLWFARRPIIHGVNALLGRNEEDAGDDRGEQEAEETDDE